MDDSGTYVNVQLVKRYLPSPSGDAVTTYSELSFRNEQRRIDEDEVLPIPSVPSELSSTSQTAEPDDLYAKVKFKTLSATRVREDREMNFRKEERSERRKSKEDEDPPISSGPSGLSATQHTAAQEQDSKVKIRIRTYRLICLFCIVTSVLILTVAGLSIHVSQIRQCTVTSERNYDELNSTLQSKLSALNSDLSVLNRMHSDLRHQFTEMETQYRSVNETKAQICEFLTNRRGQTCSENWVTNKDRCYYVSKFETSLYKAIQECSKRDSRLLEMNSRDEASFVSRKMLSSSWHYWIGKCEDRNVSYRLMYKVPSATSVCSPCDPTAVHKHYPCDHDWPFICEKSAPVFPDVLEKFQDLCRQPVE